MFLDQKTRKYYSEYFRSLKNKTVLEIGCGSGFGAEIILKYFSPKKIIATDLDQRLIVLAKKNVQKKEIVFEKADATKLNYQDRGFDGIFVYGVIHHLPLPEWKNCLKELWRVLKPKGRLFILDLSIESFKTTFWGKIIKLTSRHPYGQMYKKQEFFQYLKSIGFQIIKKVEEPRYFVLVLEKL